MHRTTFLRIFLVFLAVFLISSYSLYSVWYGGNQFVSLNSPKNYYFLNSAQNTEVPPDYINSTVTVTTYGYGISVEFYFDELNLSQNEFTVGHVYIYSQASGKDNVILDQVTVENSSATEYKEFNVPPGHYRIVTFEDLIYINENMSGVNGVLETQPGLNGSVVVHLPYPVTISYVMVASIIASSLVLILAIPFGKKSHM